MAQMAFPQVVLRQTLQNTLQPDEQLLWADHPQLKKRRSRLFSKEGGVDLVIIGIAAIPLTALFYGGISLSGHKWASLQTCLILFPVVFGLNCLTTFLRPFTEVLKKAPPYWKYTLYAITDRRAMIIVRLPFSEPV